MSWNRKQQMNAYRCASVEQGVRLGNLDLAHGKLCHALALLTIFAKFLVSIATSKKIIEYLTQAESTKFKYCTIYKSNCLFSSMWSRLDFLGQQLLSPWTKL